MGYDSRLAGFIPVLEPFNIAALPSQMFLPGKLAYRSAGLALMYQVQERPVYDSRYGDGVALFVTGIVPVDSDWLYFSNLETELDTIAAQVIEVGTSFRPITEFLVRRGYEQGDVQRYWFDAPEKDAAGVTRQRHRSEKAEMYWPSNREPVTL